MMTIKDLDVLFENSEKNFLPLLGTDVVVEISNSELRIILNIRVARRR